MHICFITHEYPKEGFPHGGIGSFVKTIATELVKNNIQVSVVGINYTATEEREVVDDVAIYRLKKSNVKGLAWYFNSKRINKTIKKIHRQTPISIIEAPESGFAFINKIRDIKFIIRLHGGHHFFAEAENRKINRWKGFQEKRSFKKADSLIAVSLYVAKITADHFKNNIDDITVIYNPVDTQKFVQVDYTKANANSILFVGSVCEKKGVRQLVQAFSIVKIKIPDVILKIVGRDWLFSDGSSYTEYLKNFITKDITSSVEILGPVSNSEIPLLIENSELCVLPSHMEAMPLAWLEVLSMGKQFVASAIGPGFEAVKDKTTGLLCDPHNPLDIAEKIIWMLEHKEESKKMGIEARKSVLEKFELKNVVKKNIVFYEQIIRS